MLGKLDNSTVTKGPTSCLLSFLFLFPLMIQDYHILYLINHADFEVYHADAINKVTAMWRNKCEKAVTENNAGIKGGGVDVSLSKSQKTT